LGAGGSHLGDAVKLLFPKPADGGQDGKVMPRAKLELA